MHSQSLFRQRSFYHMINNLQYYLKRTSNLLQKMFTPARPAHTTRIETLSIDDLLICYLFHNVTF